MPKLMSTNPPLNSFLLVKNPAKIVETSFVNFRNFIAIKYCMNTLREKFPIQTSETLLWERWKYNEFCLGYLIEISQCVNLSNQETRLLFVASKHPKSKSMCCNKFGNLFIAFVKIYIFDMTTNWKIRLTFRWNLAIHFFLPTQVSSWVKNVDIFQVLRTNVFWLFICKHFVQYDFDVWSV